MSDLTNSGHRASCARLPAEDAGWSLLLAVRALRRDGRL